MTRAITGPSRRVFAVGAAAVVLISAADVAFASTPEIEAEIKKAIGDKKAADGKIKLDLPSIAENGMTVPINFEVESQMTEKDYVKAIHFFADGNPNPLVATFRFTPMSPKAAASFRLRLAKSQNVIAVAEMASGEVFRAQKDVKVTIGGCGG